MYEEAKAFCEQSWEVEDKSRLAIVNALKEVKRARRQAEAANRESEDG